MKKLTEFLMNGVKKIKVLPSFRKISLEKFFLDMSKFLDHNSKAILNLFLKIRPKYKRAISFNHFQWILIVTLIHGLRKISLAYEIIYFISYHCQYSIACQLIANLE